MRVAKDQAMFACPYGSKSVMIRIDGAAIACSRGTFCIINLAYDQDVLDRLYGHLNDVILGIAEAEIESRRGQCKYMMTAIDHGVVVRP